MCQADLEDAQASESYAAGGCGNYEQAHCHARTDLQAGWLDDAGQGCEPGLQRHPAELSSTSRLAEK